MRYTAILLLCFAQTAGAQQARLAANRPFEITDNSFLVEEAFNQEAGIFQNILLIQRPSGREWSLEFTQEWPLFSQRHQVSYTIPVDAVRRPEAGSYDLSRGTIGLHYRLQLTTAETGVAAFSPRMSLLIPRGGDGLGVQVNLPVSKQLGNVFLHGNAGFTKEDDADARPHVAGSVVYRLRPMFHLMLESVYRFEEYETLNGSEAGWVVSPGVRGGLNIGETQLVLGAAVPVGLLNDHDTQRFIAYISYELPFL